MATSTPGSAHLIEQPIAAPGDIKPTDPWSDRSTVRRLLGRHLVGAGIELGPGHSPFELPLSGAHVTYLDRWEPEENRDLFPELGDAAEFPQPDIVCNLDVDRLKPISDESQDFVIASHVLEHVADPLGQLAEMHRVLRPGGTVLVLLPDRRATFDAGREATPLAHLVDHYEAQVTEVDDQHIIEFVRHLASTGQGADFDSLPPDAQRKEIELQRRRSIHAHCWEEDEFLEVLLYAIEQLDHEWDFVDGVLSEDEGPDGFEFGYVMRRDRHGDLAAGERRRRFTEAWTTWATERRKTHETQRAALASRQLSEEQDGRIRELEATLATAHTPLTWKATVKDLGQRAQARAMTRSLSALRTSKSSLSTSLRKRRT